MSVNLRLWRRRIGLYEFRAQRAEFYRDLAAMYRRGEAMLAFLEGELNNALLTRQRSRAAALRIILARYGSGAGGGRLEYLLRGVVPASDAMMIDGVERATNRADALMALAQAVEQQVAMKKVVRQHSVMPIVVLPICVVMISIVSDVLQTIDQSTPVYVRAQVWSGFNGMAKVISDLTASYGSGALVVVVGALALAGWSLPRWTGRARLRADALPLYSLYRDFQAGLLFSSLAMVLRAGGSLRGSIEDLAHRASPVMRWQLTRVLRSLDEAPNMTIQAFSRGVLSRPLLARAATLSRTAASFSDVLIELGTSEGDRVLQQVRRAAMVANIAVISVLGSLAAVLGLASITVPGTFASVMEPANLMAAKRAYEQAQKRNVFSNPTVR